ncbi:MAG: hypothetical protein LKJ86_05540 [Oscillibacter sp.]|jgi:hypothetical protein|nr:hypothetical protein [Oscillibacter sp.]
MGFLEMYKKSPAFPQSSSRLQSAAIDSQPHSIALYHLADLPFRFIDFTLNPGQYQWISGKMYRYLFLYRTGAVSTGPLNSQ